MLCKTERQVLKKFPHGIDKLEIGSGSNPEAGYVHLDIQKNLPKLDILADVRCLPLPNNFVVDHIRAVHIMEHFCHPQHAGKAMIRKYGSTLEILKECYRVLKPGAKLKIVTPDFARIARSAFLKRVELETLQQWSVGGHDNEFDVHHWLWTHEDAYHWFAQVGFKDLQDWNPIDKKEMIKLNLIKSAPGGKNWYRFEWQHWLFFEGTK